MGPFCNAIWRSGQHLDGVLGVMGVIVQVCPTGTRMIRSIHNFLSDGEGRDVAKNLAVR